MPISQRSTARLPHVPGNGFPVHRCRSLKPEARDPRECGHASCEATRISAARFGLPGSRAGVAAAASAMCELRPRHFAWFYQANGRRRRPGLRSRPAGYPWAKPSMAFVHLADRWKRRGFPRSAFLASCSGRLVPQSASEMAMDGISRPSRHFAWFYQANGRRRRPGLRSRPP